MLKQRPVFVRFIREICHELGLRCESFSQGWMLRISDTTRNAFIFGYHFGINPDSSAKICQDKSATSLMLAEHHIPCIPHTLFHTHAGYQDDRGNWEKMLEYFYQHNTQIVIKPNEGTGGKGVKFVDTLFKLEQCVYHRFREYPTMCFSPFIPISVEYRIIMLKGEALLVYRKHILHLRGDGETSVLSLLRTHQDKISPEIIHHLTEKRIRLDYIPSKGEIILLNWKHNLGQGAQAELVKEDQLRISLVELALLATQALNMHFASVDIVETEEGELLVLEVNAGIMLVNFASMNEDFHEIARGVYKKGIEAMMDAVIR